MEQVLDTSERANNALYPLVFQQWIEGHISLPTLIMIDKYVAKILQKDKSRDIIDWPRKIKALDGFTSFIISYIINKREFEELLSSLELP